MSGRWAQLPEAGSDAEMVTYQNAIGLQNSHQQDSLISLATTNDLPSAQRCVAPNYPAHFTKGSIIHLASGELKRIEDLSTEDFVRSADISKDLCIDTSVVRGITPVTDRDTVMLEFTVGQGQVQVSCLDTVYAHAVSLLYLKRRWPVVAAHLVIKLVLFLSIVI